MLQHLPTSAWGSESLDKIVDGALAISQVEQQFLLTQSFALHLIVSTLLFLLLLVFQLFMICLYILSLM
jgi:hypothetical protein